MAQINKSRKERIDFLENGHEAFAQDIISSCKYSQSEGPVTVKRMIEFSFESHVKQHTELQDRNRATGSMKSLISMFISGLDCALSCYNSNSKCDPSQLQRGKDKVLSTIFVCLHFPLRPKINFSSGISD